MEDQRLHNTRHTYASILLNNGESPVYVKEQLGHSSIQITVDIYGKWIQTKKEAGVNRLDMQPNATYTQPTRKSKFFALRHGFYNLLKTFLFGKRFAI